MVEQSGALLALAQPGVSRTIVSLRRIVVYMKQHYDSWVALAEASGFDGDLVFVSGTTTTTACGALAFTRPVGESTAGSTGTGTGTGAGEGALSVTWDEREGTMSAELDGRDISGRETCSTGFAAGKGAVVDGAGEGPLCVFMHYFKMKRRLWWSRPFRAASGPHELPRRRDDDDSAVRCCAGSSEDATAEECCVEVRPYPDSPWRPH